MARRGRGAHRGGGASYHDERSMSSTSSDDSHFKDRRPVLVGVSKSGSATGSGHSRGPLATDVGGDLPDDGDNCVVNKQVVDQQRLGVVSLGPGTPLRSIPEHASGDATTSDGSDADNHGTTGVVAGGKSTVPQAQAAELSQELNFGSVEY